MDIYLFRASLLLTLFYVFYLLLIRRETYFRINRLFLLTGITLSLVLPALPKIYIGSSSTDLINLMDGINVAGAMDVVTTKKGTDLINPLMIIYLSGVTWLSFRFISNLARLVFLYRRFPRTTVNGLPTVVLDGDQAPFTFFNILFITANDLENKSGESIISHEMVHIRQLHSADIILTELCTILLWFNPFAWFMRSALKAEHEYAADEGVMEEGYNKQSYQRLLFDRTLGVSAISLTNNFNYSLLKNRISMLTKNRSGIRAQVKYLLTIPLILIAVACSLTDTDQNVMNDKVYDVVDVMPEFPGGMQAVRTHLAKNLIYPEIAKDQKVSGRIFVQFVVDEDGKVTDAQVMRSDIREEIENEVVVVGYAPDEVKSSSNKEGILALEEEAVRVVSTIPDFVPGEKDGKPVKVRYTFPISFVLE